MRNGALLREECSRSGRRQVPLRAGRVPEPAAGASPLLRDRVFSRALRDDRARQSAPRARRAAGEGLRHHGAAEPVARYGQRSSASASVAATSGTLHSSTRDPARRRRLRTDAARRAWSRSGGLPVMSQPVAAASTARSTPLCVTATTDSLRRVRVRREASARRDRALRADSRRAGGRKSRPAASFRANASPWRSRNSSRSKAFPFAPIHLDQRGLALRRGARQDLRGLDRAPQRARIPRRRLGGGRRQTRACARHASTSARPRALNGMSRRPCIRPSSFHAVLPWRRNATIIARSPAPARTRGGRVLGATRRSTASMRAAAAGRSCCDVRIGHGFGCHPPPQSGIGHEASDRLGKSGGVAERDQQARAIRRHHARDAAAVAGDHGQSARLRLDERHAERLVDRGPDEEIAGAQPCGHLRRRPGSRRSRTCVGSKRANAASTSARAAPSPTMTSSQSGDAIRASASASSRYEASLRAGPHHRDGDQSQSLAASRGAHIGTPCIEAAEAANAARSRNGGTYSSSRAGSAQRCERRRSRRIEEDRRRGRLDGGHRLPITHRPFAVPLLRRDGCLGDDIRNVERAAHRGPEPIGRLVIQVIGEPDVGPHRGMRESGGRGAPANCRPSSASRACRARVAAAFEAPESRRDEGVVTGGAQRLAAAPAPVAGRRKAPDDPRA